MQKVSRLPLVVAAGGTGGDLFPVLSIVEQLGAVCNGMQVEPTFVGNPDRIEGRLIPARGYHFVGVPMRGYYGLRSMRTYSMLWRLPVSLVRVWRWMRRIQPRLAVLAGTYLSLPVAIVARALGVPIVLVEINAAPGKVNRLLARWATQIVVSYPECGEHFPAAVQARIVVTGTPVRAALHALPSPESARRQFGLDPNHPVLLVMGGSLGARSINRALAQHVEQIVSAGWQVLWQTGSADAASIPVHEGVVAMPFIEDMAAAYAAAELVVSRAGGSTIAELAVTGKPAVLVPYPHAANQEQHKNAALLVERGAAVMIADERISQELWEQLAPLLGDGERRRAMAIALRALARPDAAWTAAQVLAKVAMD